MKRGGGKRKGGEFEREVCKDLSRWVSRGNREDLFWRSAMSGGRATLGARKGKDLSHAAGDICAVHPDGHVITDVWYIECKFVKRIMLGEFMINGTGPLRKFWSKAKREAARYNRSPVLIAKQNHWPVLVIAKRGLLEDFWMSSSIKPIASCYAKRREFDVYLFSELIVSKWINS